MTSKLDLSALARETFDGVLRCLKIGKPWGDPAEAVILSALTQSHASGHAEGLEDAAKWRWAACRLLNALKALIAGTVGARQIADDAVAEASALASSDPAPRDQVADAGAIPHENCKTWDSCRREQVCFDPWNCSAALSAPRPSQPKGETP